MSKQLLQLDKYNLFTFISTSHALKAEKVLKAEGMSFIMIPTLREISASCGLSVKVDPDDLDSSADILRQNEVQSDGVYYVRKIQGKNEVHRIEI